MEPKQWPSLKQIFFLQMHKPCRSSVVHNMFHICGVATTPIQVLVYAHDLCDVCDGCGTTESDRQANPTTNPNPKPYLVAVQYGGLAMGVMCVLMLFVVSVSPEADGLQFACWHSSLF